MGSVYRRGKTYWVKYSNRGQIIRESAETATKAVAENLLKLREGKIVNGKDPGVHFDKVTFDELAREYLMDYKLNERKSLDRAERAVDQLKKVFAGYTVPMITSPKIMEYKMKRRGEDAANATINREMSALKRMLNLGAGQTPPKVDRVPKIEMLKENNVRTGFFEHADFIALRDAIAEYLKGFITFAYKTGMRLDEIKSLTWKQADLIHWTIRLEVGTTKNDKGRILSLDEELCQIFLHQKEEQLQRGTDVPFIFPNRDGTGKIRDFRGAWNLAIEEAALGAEGKRYFHDFRRTAVRNMIRAGIPEKTAMEISGHRTRSVFDRYNIINEQDIKNASVKLNAYLEAVGTKMGTIGK